MVSQYLYDISIVRLEGLSDNLCFGVSYNGRVIKRSICSSMVRCKSGFVSSITLAFNYETALLVYRYSYRCDPFTVYV